MFRTYVDQYNKLQTTETLTMTVNSNGIVSISTSPYNPATTSTTNTNLQTTTTLPTATTTQPSTGNLLLIGGLLLGSMLLFNRKK